MGTTDSRTTPQPVEVAITSDTQSLGSVYVVTGSQSVVCTHCTMLMYVSQE